MKRGAVASVQPGTLALTRGKVARSRAAPRASRPPKIDDVVGNVPYEMPLVLVADVPPTAACAVAEMSSKHRGRPAGRRQRDRGRDRGVIDIMFPNKIYGLQADFGDRCRCPVGTASVAFFPASGGTAGTSRADPFARPSLLRTASSPPVHKLNLQRELVDGEDDAEPELSEVAHSIL